MTNESALKVAYDNIRHAVRPEEIFGTFGTTDPDELKQKVKAAYRNMMKTVHADHFQMDPDLYEMANDCAAQVNQFHEQAIQRIEQGIYGSEQSTQPEAEEAPEFVIKTAKREYVISANLAEGDLSTVCSGKISGTDGADGLIAVKVIEDPDDNTFAVNEQRILKVFQDNQGAQLKHLPVLLDKFKTTDDQMGLIFKLIDGFDLEAIREKYPDGWPDKHVAWVMARLLSAIGFVHSRGVVHANLEPTHIMVRPRDHNVFVVDWSYAAYKPKVTDDKFKVYTDDFSPPEVKEQKAPIPQSDLYSLAKNMVYLLGGDPSTGSIPAKVDHRFKRFLEFFMLERAIQRPDDAWKMYQELGELRKKIWGSPQFSVKGIEM